MGPVTKLSHSKLMNLTVSGNHYKNIAEASEKYGIYAMGTNIISPFASELFFDFCKATGELCKWFMDFSLTSKSEYDDTEAFDLSIAKMGGCTPMKAMLHFGQCIKEDRF